MTHVNQCTEEELMEATWCEMVFHDGRDWKDNYDDMVAHVNVGERRFCVDITTENDREVAKARRWVLTSLTEAGITF